MPTVEIDEVELAGNHRLRETVQGMLKNPEARRHIIKAVKTAFPNAPMPPDLAAEDAVESTKDALTKEMSDIKKLLADDKAERDNEKKLEAFRKQMDAGFDKLRSEGVMEEGLAKVRETMEKDGIADPELAWLKVQKYNPPAEVADPAGSRSWNFFEQAEQAGEDPVAALMESRGKNDAIVSKLARQALKDVRGR